ncbi:MAG: type II toxin-antitoxin system HicB family antitoxin [Candidatus Methanoperedens sp.]|nr:type II toxin-antitoxin system HicB family antitoxin [Candidatus Methanoperedens sp.]
MYKYAIEIFYSEEDGGHIAIVPELPECSAFGETEEEALREIKVAIDLWLETAEKEGREIPKPTGKELLRTVVEDLTSFRTIPQGANA